MNAVLDIEVPANITLDISRVGLSTLNTNDILPGETVEFTYTHGSQYGTRTVLVVKSDYEGLEGLTLERDGEYRRYSDHYIDGRIVIVKPFVKAKPVSTTEKRVRFDDAIEALASSLSGEQLAELYLKHVALRGDAAEFDGRTGEVVVKLPEQKPALSYVFTGKTSFGLLKPDGSQLVIFIYEDQKRIGLNIRNDHTLMNEIDVSVETLKNELVKFLA